MKPTDISGYEIGGIMLSNEELKARIKELGAQITQDYAGEKPLIIGTLKGAFIFMADLIREIDLDLEIDFISASSYGMGTESSGNDKNPERAGRGACRQRYSHRGRYHRFRKYPEISEGYIFCR